MLFLTGALTSKSYAFTSRPWELRSAQSLDVLDGIGSNIRIDFKESEILRILPRKNTDINESWISDKIRFFYDGLRRQRLLTPLSKQEGRLLGLKWKMMGLKLSSILKVYSFEFGPSKIGIFVGSSVDTESLYSLKDLALNYGFSNLGFEKSLKVNFDNPRNYKFQSLIKNFEKVDFCLLLGTNPRFEASTLNLRLRKIYTRDRRRLSFASLGGNFLSTFPVNFLGLTPSTLVQISEGKHSLCKTLVRAKTPAILYASSILERFDSLGFQNILSSLTNSLDILFEKTLHVNLLHNDANSVGALELGLQPLKKDSVGDLKLIYAVGLNQKQSYKELKKMSDSMVIFQNSIGDQQTNIADIVLPSTTFVEESGIYYNTEGRAQKTQRVLIGPNLAKENWKISRFLFELLDKTASYTEGLHLSELLGRVLPSSFLLNFWFLDNSRNYIEVKVNLEVVVFSYLKFPIGDVFMTHNFCRTSKTMAKASKFLRLGLTNYKAFA
jgi:NADH dehydrogenase/NADH:ubiquinone oxidoreductase subunit G